MIDQMSNPVTSEKLYDSPLWRAKLEWMKENNPEQVRQLFRQNKLKGVLDQSTARLMDRVQYLQNNGWTPEEAHNLVFLNEVKDENWNAAANPQQPLSEEELQRLRAWHHNLNSSGK
jgi:hypothetical protein